MNKKSLQILSALALIAPALAQQPSPLPADPTPPSIFTGRRYPAACIPFWGKPQMVDCFLSDPVNKPIADSIYWSFPGTPPSYLPWSQWPSTAQAGLRKAFQDTVNWRNSGMGNYPGTLPADPPVALNTSSLMNGVSVNPIIDGATAWSIFSSHAAMNLAAEIYAWVPWSLRNYDGAMLGTLFFSHMAECGEAVRGGYCLYGQATPAHATYAYRFLVTNRLIGATQRETIERVQNMFYHWQYWGFPGFPHRRGRHQHRPGEQLQLVGSPALDGRLHRNHGVPRVDHEANQYSRAFQGRGWARHAVLSK